MSIFKIHILLFLLSIISINVIGQISQDPIGYNPSDGIHEIIEKKFNTVDEFVNDQFELVDTLLFDQSGNQISLVRYDMDNQIMFEENRTYDREGRIFEQVKIHHDVNSTSTTYYHYENSIDNFKIITIQEYIESILQQTKVIEFNIDKNIQEVKEFDKDVRLKSRTYNYFNKEGQIVKQEKYSAEKKLISILEYEYDQNLLIKRISCDSVGAFNFQDSIRYDGQQNILMSIKTKKDGFQEVTKYGRVYFDGYYEEEKKVDDVIREFTIYRNDKKIIEKTSFDSEGQFVSTINYEWDDKGDAISEVTHWKKGREIRTRKIKYYD